ncbi:MAG: hypothetical protein JWQ98_838 [Chlorobi bacterium]|nr:hypothetical protein [Chlorobiota bacterium]
MLAVAIITASIVPFPDPCRESNHSPHTTTPVSGQISAINSSGMIPIQGVAPGLHLLLYATTRIRDHHFITSGQYPSISLHGNMMGKGS